MCMHIHGVFPYVYVALEHEPDESYLQRLAQAIDKAINLSLGRPSSYTQHVFSISVVQGMWVGLGCIAVNTTGEPYVWRNQSLFEIISLAKFLVSLSLFSKVQTLTIHEEGLILGLWNWISEHNFYNMDGHHHRPMSLWLSFFCENRSTSSMCTSTIIISCMYFCRPYYGFHHKTSVFLKIYIYNPLLVSR